MFWLDKNCQFNFGRHLVFYQELISHLAYQNGGRFFAYILACQNFDMPKIWVANHSDPSAVSPIQQQQFIRSNQQHAKPNQPLGVLSPRLQLHPTLSTKGCSYMIRHVHACRCSYNPMFLLLQKKKKSYVLLLYLTNITPMFRGCLVSDAKLQSMSHQKESQYLEILNKD